MECHKGFLGGGFKCSLMLTPTWGNDPIWLLFFRWVETTPLVFITAHLFRFDFLVVEWMPSTIYPWELPRPIQRFCPARSGWTALYHGKRCIFNDLDLFKVVIFYGFYQGKSPSNHHFGEYFLLFPSILGKSKMSFGLVWLICLAQIRHTC